jgi:2-polyprenyl-6-hydroxyphenyl methylase/3-demethylubiquinone-9 3-methyltransferase
MNTATHNVDADEIKKFEKLASRWWDPHSEFKPLHDINPLRLDYIDRLAPLTGRHVIDIGCGGGLLTEGMAQRGANVIGIDMGKAPDYRQTTAEQMAAEQGGSFDTVTCLEMLEHVPDPARVIAACAQLIKDDGYIFLSTINRNPKAYLFAVIGAEYLLRLLPTGTHDYSKFIRPSAYRYELQPADTGIQTGHRCFSQLSCLLSQGLTDQHNAGYRNTHHPV